MSQLIKDLEACKREADLAGPFGKYSMMNITGQDAKNILELIRAAQVARKVIDDFYARGGNDDDLWFGRDCIDKWLAAMGIKVQS